MEKCKLCGRKKTWTGSDIECPFSKPVNAFTRDNWNCGVISRIRALCEEVMLHPEDPSTQYQYIDDQKYVIFNIDDVTLPPIHEDEMEVHIGLALWVSWYKSRGRTEAMWVLDNYNNPRKPNYYELDKIATHYEKIFNK